MWNRAVQALYLFNNSLSGPLPATLPTALSDFRASNNRLSGRCACAHAMQACRAPALYWLSCTDSSGPEPTPTHGCVNEHHPPSAPASLASSQRLSPHCSISSTWPEGLEWLLLDGNELTGAIPTGLPDSLTVVDFSSNRWVHRWWLCSSRGGEPAARMAHTPVAAGVPPFFVFAT